MVSVHGYNAEKKDKSFLNIYIFAVIFGTFSALILIGGGITIMRVLNFLVTKWVWFMIAALASLFVWKFVINKKTKRQLPPPPYEYQN